MKLLRRDRSSRIYKETLPDSTKMAVNILFMMDEDGMNELVKRVEIPAHMFRKEECTEEDTVVLEEIWVDFIGNN